MDLHHRFNVVSRQLTGLDDPNTNLRGKRTKKNKAAVAESAREQIHKYTGAYKGATCAVSMKVKEELPRSPVKTSDCFEKNSNRIFLLHC